MEKEKLVLVTGATRGLGLVIARTLLLQGYKVVGTGRSKDRPSTWSMAEDDGLIYQSLDLEEHGNHQGFVRSVVKEYGPLYGLINNAAIGTGGVLATMHERDIETLVMTNVLGTIILTKYAIRSMLLSGVGRVINISSIIADTGFNGLSVYGASKSALNGFTRSLAREIGKAGITVNNVSPGYMATDMSSSIGEEDLAKIIRRSPLGRLVVPVDVANVVSLLVSPAGENITGVDYKVDAGSTI